MKQTYIFCLLLVSLFSTAQIINFPDANFKARLLGANPGSNIASTEQIIYTTNDGSYSSSSISYTTIDSNNNGEIEVSEASLIKFLNIPAAEITNLEGLSNFTNLQYLKCDYNQITNIDLSTLTNLTYLHCGENDITNLNLSTNVNLKYLFCYSNNLTTLSMSPSSDLQLIYCFENQITNLDITQNINLKTLYCYNNQLSTLNLTQNSFLLDLNCENNLLSSLNTLLNVYLKILISGNNAITNLDLTQNINLETLDVSYNQISSLNISQNTQLRGLYCNNNQLTNLNVTQNINLQTLAATYNQLSNLDILTNVALIELFCGNNSIQNLDVSPNTNLWSLHCENNLMSTIQFGNITNIIDLVCSNNQLTNLNLNQFPNLETIEAGNNQLQSIAIKNGYNNSVANNAFFDFSGNPNLQYMCVDEIELNGIQTQATQYGYTNCQVNSYCNFIPGGTYYAINGQNKFDNENDGCDVSDATFANLKFSITDGTTSGTLISNGTGNFAIDVQTGSHTITPILENPSYFNVSPTNVVVDFPTQVSPVIQDFCVAPNGIHHDVEVSILPINVARPGFDANYKIIYKNKGNQTENGIISFQFSDDVLDLVSTNPAFATQTINNLTFNYSNLLPFETREINVVFNVNSPMESPAVNAGDIISYTATNTIVDTDEMLSDNTFVLNQTVFNSYDPNDKTCLQGNTIAPSEVGKYVHYMIRFENTGTFPAENIVVKDMIDITKFDVNSLIPLKASHNYVTKITGNKVEFIFENINLPFDDANNDGYVAFKIKTLPTLVLGNTFSNSANIYFDYNFPIITNTATTTIAALSNPSFEFANYFSLYPNPTTSELNINLKSAIEINSIQIYNNIGQLVTVQKGNALKVDVSNLKTGNYFIKINTNDGFSTSQFIKE